MPPTSFLTEREARACWCPQATSTPRSSPDADHAPASRPPGDNASCLGRTCMWWRWRADCAAPDGEPVGYCGAAIRPEL